MQALQGTIEAVSAHAAQIAKNEKSVQIADNDGVLQPVVDEGGRHCIKSLVLDVQQVVRSFDGKSRAALETAQAGADMRRTVCRRHLRFLRSSLWIHSMLGPGLPHTLSGGTAMVLRIWTESGPC